MIDQKIDNEFKIELLHPKFIGTWLLILFFCILAYFPVRIRDFLAELLSHCLFLIPKSFKRKVYKNLDYAFPDLEKDKKDQLYRNFVRVGLKVVLGYGIPFVRSKEYVKDSYKITGQENLDRAVSKNKPILFVGSHCWTLDSSGIFLGSKYEKVVGLVHSSHNPVHNYCMNKMRLKFGGKVYERKDGIKNIIKCLKEGYYFAFYPDLDLGTDGSIFVDFWGAKKATLTAVPRIVKLSDALVVPMTPTYNEQEHKYEITFYPHFENYPSNDLEADVRRVNKAIEDGLKDREEQYMWFLHFYRTRPENVEK